MAPAPVVEDVDSQSRSLPHGRTAAILPSPAALRVALMEAEAQGRPFFVQCNINDPHRPFYGSPQAAAMDHGQQGVYRAAKPVGPAPMTSTSNARFALL